MKKYVIIATLTLFCMAQLPASAQKRSDKSGVTYISTSIVDKTIKDLVAKHGSTYNSLIERGVKQMASLWQKEDGEENAFHNFAMEKYISDPAKRLQLFEKLQYSYEVLYGNYGKMSMDLRVPVDLNEGEITSVDEMFAAYSPGSHLTEDLFSNKIAFITMLNFPAYTLTEKSENASKWSRQDWAYARMGDMFTSRVPAKLNQEVGEALTKSDLYISEYNIMMGNLVDAKGKTYFPKGMNLITHWGLRDELKSHYGKGDEGLKKQEMVYAVMKRIIDQTIPEKVINNVAYQWNPMDNKVLENGKNVTFTSEPDRRYQMLLNNFKALSATDKYYPVTPTYIQRAFELNMEIPEKDVQKLFTDLVSFEQIKKTAALISKRLGRNLRPFDIWYDGFKSRSTLNEDDLTKQTQALYPNAAAFEKDIPNILTKLGWSKDRANYLASKIRVDAARGSGHAAGASMKGDKARLRTRIVDGGMNYKGYNIAVHEFGHNVEQTIDLYDIDYYMLQGVPNTAFTEALAFLFQKRDLDLLGIKDNNPDKEALASLDAIWSCYEIMGVSLVDMKVWHWMYDHPNATASELKEAVIASAKDVWNSYYAPVFGMKDEPVLGIYSHMIDNPLYLSNYPIGHLIDFQMDGYLKGKNFPNEVDRIYKLGRLIPQEWMKQAVGAPLSIQPLLKATDKALKNLEK